uniref:Transport and Golgi organization protein 2 n=1 Tax=Strongyloides stercoralis TaxID=6248 RepID=A0A0K0EJV7_STRER
MCVTFFYFSKSSVDGRYKLILINNRDEFLDRKTLSASWIDGILCGRDLKDKARGTWLGVTSKSDGTFKLSNLLSVTSKRERFKSNAASRGEIVINYLKKNLTPMDYCNEIKEVINEYNGFTLINMEKKKGKDIECYLLSSKMSPKPETIRYTEGIYGIGNSGLDESYEKVENSFNVSENDIIEECLKILKDDEKCIPDPVMERLSEHKPITPFCSIFIPAEASIRYGTRTHTIVIVDNNDKVTFFETTAENINSNLDTMKWIENKYTFQL